MWRCPRCVTHCKDEQDACPTCQHARPEQPVDRGEEDWSDLDAMFPPKSDPSDEAAETHPLLPALHKRDVEQKISRYWSPRAFWIAAVGVMIVVMFNGAGKWEDVDFFSLLGIFVQGAVAGAALGVFVGFVGGMVSCTYQVLFSENRPPDERLAKLQSDPESRSDREDTRSDTEPSEAIRPSSSDLHPGDRP
jgi:hypothetical protein